MTGLSPTPRSISELQDWLARRPWEELTLPDEVSDVPTMLSIEERQLLYFLGREVFAYNGSIVDAGCFLGGSTVALGRGLRDRSAPPTPTITSYDMVRVEEYTLEHFSEALPSTQIGASFRSAFDQNVDAVNTYLTVREGDITGIGWSGEPIEILFLDVCKSWDINDVVLQQFFPALRPGAIVVQQDYFWAPTAWLQISMELLAESFALVGRVGTSAVYVLTSTLPGSLDRICLARDVSEAEQLELLDRALGNWDGEARGLLELSKAGFLAERLGNDAGREALDAVIRLYAAYPSVALCARNMSVWLGPASPSATPPRRQRPMVDSGSVRGLVSDAARSDTEVVRRWRGVLERVRALEPEVGVGDFFPSIEEELGSHRHLFVGKVLNAGAGNRDISHLVSGELVNQDIETGTHNENIHVYSPLHAIPFDDGYFDVVICNAVLEHIENPDEVVAEFARVVRPGGTLYLCVPFMQPEHLDPTDFQRYTLDGLTSLVRHHGFDVRETSAMHSVYTTLGWILLDWLRPFPGWRGWVLRWTILPWVRRKAMVSKSQIHSLASAYRVIGERRQ